MATVVSAERSGKAATVSSVGAPSYTLTFVNGDCDSCIPARWQVVDVYRERLTALDAEACARAGVQPADAADALRYHGEILGPPVSLARLLVSITGPPVNPSPSGSAADVRAAEASVLATHPLRLAGDAAALAAALDLPAGGGRAEAAVTLAELGALVASVTAAAPGCIGPALQAVQAEQHGSEAEAIASVADKARALATRRLLAASPVWRGRPAAFSWAAQLHCATDAAAAAAYKREVLATHGAVVEALQRMSDPSAGGEGGMMMGMD